MKKTLILTFILAFCLSLVEAKDKTICLNMIVKDESKVITRCLETIKPLIDYWVIVDTGSTDGTQQIIKDFMKDIPGKLYERPWVDFAHNRNEALALAKNCGDFLLFIDADEQLIFSKDFVKPKLNKDAYNVLIHHDGSQYTRKQLINNRLDWKWIGVLHEYLHCENTQSEETIKGVYNLYGFDGCRSNDPNKFKKDAAVLEKALLKEPNNARYVFYLAQSYRDAGENHLAIKYYTKRAEMGGWDQEIFWSLYQIGLLQEHINEPESTITKSYLKAYQYRPSRKEPLHRLAHYHATQGNHILGYLLATHALSLPPSTDCLMVETWMDEYGLLMEKSLCAYYLGKYEESKTACDKILNTPNIPDNIRECMQNNLISWIEPQAKKAA